MTRKTFRAQTLSSNSVQLKANSQYVALRADDLLANNLIFTLPSIYGVEGQALTTDGSGGLLFSNVSDGSSTLSVGTTNASNVVSNAVSGVSTIVFDLDSGFDVVDLGNDVVKVQINSTFKFWEIAGQETLIAEGIDTVNIVAGENINLTTNAEVKSLTISSTGGAANDYATYSTLTANTYNTYVNIYSLIDDVQSNLNSIDSNTRVYVDNNLISNTSITLTAGDGIEIAANIDSKEVAFSVNMSNVTSQTIELDGSTNSFSLVKSVPNKNMVFVIYNGLIQNPATYSIDSTTLTLSNDAPILAGSSIELRYLDLFNFPGS